ncbi:SAM-dependent methyltransferase [Bacillus sp. BA3]|uniref:BREX-1 system adenine-specific DNA-methyltransferase PglX n=1 Tax=Bacillus sp. BA3 TaxID=2057910 RepID=UPI000C34EE4A|nr:BREX-1 system adenine-specific DNA-methyltransferase PglX [Bacillus sp. BA3]PKF86733.1 SAM-dependent methyltransferase [Bacillus sp. BA3]
MNKSALKTFATSARKELLKKVEAKAMKIGVTEDNIKKADVESSDAIYIDGRQLSREEKTQRDKLIARINQIGFKQVMEEVAYTWFNRFTALRFMEVNDYLPSGVRVLSSSNSDSADPDMLNEALELDLEVELDKEHIYYLKLNNEIEELFKYLIIKHCNDLNKYLPFMFETIDDYSEILFPEGLLARDSFIQQMTDTEAIPEDNWEKIEVIGWLYQYYIAEQKDRVFKAKIKYKAEEIPYATQLFTPDWIVQFMVQNSLGKYWTESHPEHEDLINNWEFIIVNQQEDFQEKIAPFINRGLNVEDIKCFDPAMGSGHILVYLFDVLYEIYSKCGYIEREIPRHIIENNLYGLDIDDRAYQLASFSVVMKALQYNRKFLRSIERDGLTLNLASIQETNGWTDEAIAYIAGEEDGEQFNTTKAFFEQYTNAKTFGSLIKVMETDTGFLEDRLKELKETPVTDLFQEEKREQSLEFLPLLIKQTKIMGQLYDIVVMNPPYMGSGNMNEELSDFLKKNYPDSKSDLFSAFMEIDHYLKENGFYAAINQHSWMFLSSFEKLREKVINHKFIDTMLHLGPRAFEEIGGEVVQSTTFVLRNTILQESKGTYIRLVNERTAVEKKERAIQAVQNPLVPYRYTFDQVKFSNITGSSIAYWINKPMMHLLSSEQTIGKAYEVGSGLSTSDNVRFLRYHWEVSRDKISGSKDSTEGKWFLFQKGGEFRRWYGNLLHVVNWENEGEEIKHWVTNNPKDPDTTHWSRRIFNTNLYFRRGITWSVIGSGKISFRLTESNSMISNAAGGIFGDFSDSELYSLLGALNSKLWGEIFSIINPTINYSSGIIQKAPLPNITKLELNNTCVQISREDWDSFEISFDFLRHPLITFQANNMTIADSYSLWDQHTCKQFDKLKAKEEELNQFINKIYNIDNELTCDIDDEDITINRADYSRDLRSFISYAVGNILGRYSLDQDGLIFAGGKFNPEKYKSFEVDRDNILPILSGAYFEDDIVSRFVDFVRVTFSEEKLEENLDFIVDAIGRKNNETAREALRRYFLNDFYRDHVQVYKKRPIYWLFTSGKQKAFNCLIYMHRYDKTTLSRIRTDYLHEYQIRLGAEKKDLLSIIEGDYTTKEISNAKKKLKTLDKKIEELKEYDELLHHMADMQIEIHLDDGVAVNYEKFKGLVAKI